MHWQTPIWVHLVQRNIIEVSQPYLPIFDQFSPILRGMFHWKVLGRIYLSRSVYSALPYLFFHPHCAWTIPEQSPWFNPIAMDRVWVEQTLIETRGCSYSHIWHHWQAAKCKSNSENYKFCYCLVRSACQLGRAHQNEWIWYTIFARNGLCKNVIWG